MSRHEHPRWHHTERSRGERVLRRGARLLAGAGLVAAAVLIVWQQALVRDGEADLAGHWFGSLLTGQAISVRDSVYFPWVHGPLIGLRVTWECTVALLASPLCLIGGVLMGCTSIRWPRLLLGLLAALAAVVAVNQLRLLMIAVAIQHWGLPGYDVSHKFVGSLFALAGFAASLVLLLRIASSQPRANRR